ncbi:FAD-dependent oxidoreductase [Streptomyces sp. NPDC001455]|uniref:FAD-dependent oxidoreductase n=1 Tax=unclassified Streptomyces TaxID=2593676 RepID=UPI0033282E64
MREETVTSDIIVVGGGLAGVCAAIAAARLGRRVSLVHNRPVPGGNRAAGYGCGCAGRPRTAPSGGPARPASWASSVWRTSTATRRAIRTTGTRWSWTRCSPSRI